jgi:hypothetical protein
MITLADDERDTALRAARSTLAMLRSKDENEVTTKNIANVERLIVVLSQESSLMRNGVWRCLCPGPWRLPDVLVCPTCGAAWP